MSVITIFTTTGRALLAAAVANGQALASAKLAVGDGNGAIYVPNEAQTALVHETWRGAASVARTEDLVVFQATIPSEIGGFVVREVGLFIGAPGAEQLFIVSQSPSREKIAAPANGASPMAVSIQFSANAAQVAVLPASASGVAVLQLANTPHITVDGIITAPPANPVDGEIYAIADQATGLFAGQSGSLVERVSGTWVFRPVRQRSVVRIDDNGDWYERLGDGWSVCPFNDSLVAWAEITGKPGEFPPAVHNHDDRYFTEAEVAVLLATKSDVGHTHDGAYVKLNPVGGAAQTVTGPLMMTQVYSGNLGGGTYARVCISNTTDKGYIEAFQGGDGNVKATLGLNPWGGNVGVGTVFPTEKLDVNGNARVRGNMLIDAIGSTTVIGPGLGDGASNTATNVMLTSWWGLGFGPSIAGQVVPLGQNSHWFDTRNGNVGLRGALFLAGNDAGAPAQVIASQGAGAPAQYRNVNDLINIPALFPAGRVIAALDIGPATHAVGCTVVADGLGAMGAESASMAAQETIWRVDFSPAIAALIGSAADYRVMGVCRRALGLNTYVYNSNGDGFGQYLAIIPVAIADALETKAVSYFRVRSVSHLSLIVYKV